MVRLSFIFILILGVNQAHAGIWSDNPRNITHCYHYLKESWENAKFLKEKYQRAANTKGEFYNVAGKNGATYGPGLYCAKTPISTSFYGDRVIRLDLTDDVVIEDTFDKPKGKVKNDKTEGKKYCRTGQQSFTSDEACQAKPIQVRYVEGKNDWYAITDLKAIKRWSANSFKLSQDLSENLKNMSAANGKTFQNSSNNGIPKLTSLLQAVVKAIEAERKAMGTSIYIPGFESLSLEQLKSTGNLDMSSPLDVAVAILKDQQNSVDPMEKQELLKAALQQALRNSHISFAMLNEVMRIDKLIAETLRQILVDLQESEVAPLNKPLARELIKKLDLSQRIHQSILAQINK